MKNAKVCIILPSYNHASFIRQSIESVLNQTYTDYHLIIWDDGSTDQSWEIISEYTDSRIQSFRNPLNQTKVMNKVISTISDKYEYIAIHHSDDIWESEKLEKQVAFMEERPEIGAVFTRATAMDEQGLPLKDTSHFYHSIFDQPNRSRHEWLRYFFMHQNALCHPSVLLRRECYEKCGTYQHSLIQLPDFDMWVRLTMKYEIYVMPERLVRFRVLDDEKNSSGNRKDARIRVNLELYKVLQSFKNIHSFQELVAVFPEAQDYDRGLDTDVHFAMAMCGLQLSSHHQNKLFCYDLLYEAMNDMARRKNLEEVYAFYIQDYKAITGDLDVFGYEQMKETQDLIAHLTNKNKELLNKIQQGKNESHELVNKLEEKETELEYYLHQNRDLQSTLQQITQSKSWKLTKPLRGLVKLIKKLK